VGGVVRDNLINKSSKDIYLLITNLEVNKIVEILNCHGKVNVVGKSFGIFKFREHNSQTDDYFDIAIPRKEIKKGKHDSFDLSCDPLLPIEQYLRRKDFTMNAIAQDVISGEIIDPFDGQLDIYNKRIRIISSNSFEELYSFHRD